MPHHGKTTPTTAGFSLAQLLIVIAIIAMLFGLFVPCLVTVRNMARQVSCMASQRQIGMAFGVYHSDNGCYPPPFLCRMDSDGTRVLDFFIADGGIKSRFWYGALAGVLGDSKKSTTKAWVCPSACFPKLTGTDACAGSYGYNNSAAFYTRTFQETNGYTKGLRLVKIPCPSSCILIGERWAADPSGTISDLNWNVVPPWDASGRAPMETPVHAGGNSASLRLSHRGRSNSLYVDQHVACRGPLDGVAPGITSDNESSAQPNIWFGRE